jgi:CheY-like chemotaxis protein
MKTILLIEDNDEIRENTAEILELAMYNVFTASNGKLGVEKAVDIKPDLIICDIMMPVLDGYGVLHAIQKQEEIKPEITGEYNLMMFNLLSVCVYNYFNSYLSITIFNVSLRVHFYVRTARIIIL